MSAQATTDLSGKTSASPIIIDLRDLWTLYYRKGQNPYPMAKNFHLKQTTNDPEKRLRAAMEVGRSHCEMITARFIRCVPLISDLLIDEQKHQENE